MPRPYQTGTGVSMSGRTYEPQVTPWEREDDDFDVYQGTTRDRDRQASGRYGPDDDYAPPAGDRRYFGDRGYRSNDGQDAYTRRDLEPTYQDAYERDRDRYGGDRDDRAYRGANRDRDLLGDRRDERRDERRFRDREDRDESYVRDRPSQDRPWTGFASGYDRRR